MSPISALCADFYSVYADYSIIQVDRPLQGRVDGLIAADSVIW